MQESTGPEPADERQIRSWSIAKVKWTTDGGLLPCSWVSSGTRLRERWVHDVLKRLVADNSWGDEEYFVAGCALLAGRQVEVRNLLRSPASRLEGVHRVALGGMTRLTS